MKNLAPCDYPGIIKESPHNPTGSPRCLGPIRVLRRETVPGAPLEELARERAFPNGEAFPLEEPTDGDLPIELSLVVPAFNEEDNIAVLCDEIVQALSGRLRFEIVVVDDGSTDATPEKLRKLAFRDERVTAVLLTQNSGQTMATWVGLRAARGRLICTLDADLQNNPADIPKLLDALGDDDAVVGYRQTRQDNFVRRISSRIANSIRNRVSGDSIRDTGCSLKLFRADAIRAIPFFDGMHRFLPTLLRYHGYTVSEVPVSHRPRVAGVSKYGIRNRALRAAKDLLAVRWMRDRILNPVECTVVRAEKRSR